MEYIIGLDIGTSSVKGVLVTVDGKIRQTAREAFSYTRLENGGVEISAEDYLNACMKAIRTLASAGDNRWIKGICASSASGNLLLLGSEGNPITPIINWQDKRVTDEVRAVFPELDPAVYYRRIGWPFQFNSFPLAQLCYIKKHSPELLERCEKVCMSTEYLYYVLTGKWGISNSAGTTFFLIDQERGCYIPELLEGLGIEEEKLPPVCPCGHVVGAVKPGMEEVCGLLEGTPVFLGSFDHPSAARAVGVKNEGEMLLSCGTSWVAFLPLTDRKKGLDAGMLVDPFLSPEGCYGAMVSVSSLSDRLKLYTERYIGLGPDSYRQLSDLAKKSEPGAGGLQINLLEEPDDSTILAYPKAHIARAVMEGAVLLLKRRLDKLAEYDIRAKKAVMVGGPSEDPFWATLIEQMCGINVTVQHGAFAGAVGAASIAGMRIEYGEK